MNPKPATAQDLRGIEAHPATLLSLSALGGYAVSVPQGVILPLDGELTVIFGLVGGRVDSLTTSYSLTTPYGVLDRLAELGILPLYRYSSAWLWQIQQHPTVKLRLRFCSPHGLWVYERTLAGQFVDYVAATRTLRASGPTLRQALGNLEKQERVALTSWEWGEEHLASFAEREKIYRSLPRPKRGGGVCFLKQTHKNPVFKELVITPMVVLKSSSPIFNPPASSPLNGVLYEDITYQPVAGYWHRWYRYLAHHTAVRVRLIEETPSHVVRMRTFLISDLNLAARVLPQLEVSLLEAVLGGEALLAPHLVDRGAYLSIDWTYELQRLAL